MTSYAEQPPSGPINARPVSDLTVVAAGSTSAASTSADHDRLSLVRATRCRAWMLLVPVDVLAILAPAAAIPRQALWLSATALVTVLARAGARCERLHLGVLDELPGLLGTQLAAIGFVAMLSTVTTGATRTYLMAGLASVLTVILARTVTTPLLVLARRRGRLSRRTVVVGGHALGAELVAILDRYPRYGLSVVGVIDDEAGCAAAAHTRHLGPIDQLLGVVRAQQVQVVLIAPVRFSEERLVELFDPLEHRHCELLLVPRLGEGVAQVGVNDHIGSIPVTRVRLPRLHGPAWRVKRAADVVISMIALVALSPVLGICALAARLGDGPGVLFRQDRVGRNGAVFSCLKFRTISSTATESATRWSVAGDPGMGRVGRVLRRCCLDELPQLWNVVRGEMSLVGPRPERPHFVREFGDELPRYDHRHRVPAGITGLAQVSGLRGDTCIGDRVRFDNYYVENWSLWLDVKILLRTVPAVLFAGDH